MLKAGKRIVQRRLDQLEMVDTNSALDGSLQKLLRVCTGRQLGLRDSAEMVEALDQTRLIQKAAVTRKFNSYGVFAVGALDCRQFSFQHTPPLVDEAYGIAHHLYLLHAVCRQDDGGAFLP